MLVEIVTAHHPGIAVWPGQHERYGQSVSVTILIGDNVGIVVTLIVMIIDEGENVKVFPIAIAETRAEL